MANKSPLVVYISYARKDRKFVTQLQERLETAGFMVWPDPPREEPPVSFFGAGWLERNLIGPTEPEVSHDNRPVVDASSPESDEKAIRDASALVVVMSPNAIREPRVENEWTFGLNHNKAILILMLEPTPLPRRLQSQGYLNFTNPNSRTWEKFISHLKEAVKSDSRLPEKSQKDEDTAPAIDLESEEKNQNHSTPTIHTSGSQIGASSDTVGREDQLNFTPYVKAFADLILSPDTDLPLTIGIFGAWGMGKSFLLKNIAEELRNHPQIHTITFNAWEYGAAAVVWPGLIRIVMDALEDQVGRRFPGKRIRRVRRNSRRSVRQSPGVFLAASLALIAFLVLVVSVNITDFHIDSNILNGIGFAAVLGVILKLIKDGATPLGQWVTSLTRERDYGSCIGYMTEIRDDLEALLALLEDDKRLLIVIDDLDRCEPEKAVEVLRAVKLLLNFEPFVICLGIDARIMSLAVEKHYADLPGKAGASGYEYLDKIVQIPFLIPEPDKNVIKGFLRKQMNRPEMVESGVEPAPPQPEPAPLHPEPGFADLSFTDDEEAAFEELADKKLLRPNPRHIKRLLNIYRLVRQLAVYKGERGKLDPYMTIRWLAMCGQWPFTVHQMLGKFDELSIGTRPGAIKNPLRYLFDEVQGEIRSNDGLKLRQDRLDHTISLLEQLIDIEGAAGWITWRELKLLQEYTINFNPAITEVYTPDDEKN